MADEPDTIIIGAPEPAEPQSRAVMPTTEPARDVLSPHEVADRAGFSYHAILRAIRRGDLQAFEPVPGHYRIEVVEYERWLRRPARRNLPSRAAAGSPPRAQAASRGPDTAGQLRASASA